MVSKVLKAKKSKGQCINWCNWLKEVLKCQWTVKSGSFQGAINEQVNKDVENIIIG